MRSNSSLRPSASVQRRVELAAPQEGLEDAERGGPGADADGRAGLGERLGDGEAEAAVVGDAGDERALAREIDGEHGPTHSAKSTCRQAAFGLAWPR